MPKRATFALLLLGPGLSDTAPALAEPPGEGQPCPELADGVLVKLATVEIWPDLNAQSNTVEFTGVLQLRSSDFGP